MELFGNGPSLPVVVAESNRHVLSLQVGWVGKQEPVPAMAEPIGIPFQAGLAARFNQRAILNHFETKLSPPSWLRAIFRWFPMMPRMLSIREPSDSSAT